MNDLSPIAASQAAPAHRSAGNVRRSNRRLGDLADFIDCHDGQACAQ